MTRGRPRAFDRQAALQQAMLLFWRRGYEGTSIADLREAMGINAPSLYAAFGSKEQLYREALDHYQATEGDLIWGAFLRGTTARDSIESYLRATAEHFASGRVPTGCMVALGDANLSPINTAIRETNRQMRAVTLEQVEARLLADMDKGLIPAGTDCRKVAYYYVTVQYGMSIQARDGVDVAGLTAIAEAALAAWGSLVGDKQ